MVSEIIELTEQLYKLSIEYAHLREKASHSKQKIDVFLTANLTDLRKKKTNAGIETLYLMLREINLPGVDSFFIEWESSEAKYKGLEKVIDAVKEKINVRKLILKLDGGDNDNQFR